MIRSCACVFLVMPITALACTTAVFKDGFDSAVCGADPGVRVAITALPSERPVTLGGAARFAIQVRSCGYSGPVSLGTIGLPASWTASYPQSSVDLQDGESHDTMLTIEVPGNAISGCEPFAATAQVSAQEIASAELLLNVENVFLVTEPAGTGSGIHPYPSLVRVRAGAIIRFRNDDAAQHVLHGEGIVPHEATFDGGPGRVIDVPTSVAGQAGSFYCHTHGQGLGGGDLIVE